VTLQTFIFAGIVPRAACSRPSGFTDWGVMVIVSPPLGEIISTQGFVVVKHSLSPSGRTDKLHPASAIAPINRIHRVNVFFIIWGEKCIKLSYCQRKIIVFNLGMPFLCILCKLFFLFERWGISLFDE
jgi:hypothetical protein